MEGITNPDPHFPDPLNIPEDIDTKLHKVVDVEELGYVFLGHNRDKEELKGEVPLIGFAGAPRTLFGYMIEEATRCKRPRVGCIPVSFGIEGPTSQDCGGLCAIRWSGECRSTGDGVYE